MELYLTNPMGHFKFSKCKMLINC